MPKIWMEKEEWFSVKWIKEFYILPIVHLDLDPSKKPV